MDVIVALISVVSLIVFFVMAANLAVIKNILRTDRRKQARLEYLKNRAAGNKKEAYEELLYIVYYELDETSSESSRKNKYAELEHSFTGLFKDLGYEFPVDLGAAK